MLCVESEPTPACFKAVDGGRFLMGAQATDPAAPGYDPLAKPDEGPPHEVTLPPFWVTASEIPYWMYTRCVAAERCAPLDPSVPVPTVLDTPVTQVTWQEARDVCAWLGGRLPSEAEWEYVARAGDTRRYPWGSNPICPPNTAPALESQTTHRDAVLARCGKVAAAMFDQLKPEELDRVGRGLDLWTVEQGAAVCAEVEALPAEQISSAMKARAEQAIADAERGVSPLRCDRADVVEVMAAVDKHPWKLLGLAGNVFEWVVDGYDPAFYARSPGSSPAAPPAERHVIRGGSTASTELTEWRTTARSSMPSGARTSDVGLRCVRDTAP